MPWTVAQQNSSMNQLINEGGLSQYGAAALVSRWSNVEDPNGSGSTMGGYEGHAWGIGQWLGSRKTDLTNFADQYELDPNDPDTQTQFAIWEGANTEQPAWNQLAGADDASSGALAAQSYERSGPATVAGDISKTQSGIPSVLSNYQNGGADTGTTSGGGPSDQGLSGNGSPNLDDEQSDAGNPESNEQVSNDINTGNIAGANSSVDASADAGVTGETPDASTPGTDLTTAVNAQTKQLAANIKAQTAAAATIAKGQSTLDTGLVSSIESFAGNTFVRGALIFVGIVFILAGVLGLSFGGLSGAHAALSKPLHV